MPHNRETLQIPLVHHYRGLRSNCQFSCEKIKDLRVVLAEALADFDGKRLTVAVAGSLGRFEASELSDADLIIITDDAEQGDHVRQEIIPDLIVKAGFKAPNPKGVFSRTAQLEQLTSKIGEMDEDIITHSQRLLLLLETRPLFNDDEYNRVVTTIFNEYANSVRSEPHKQFAFLLNDLIKYFRVVCVGYQAQFWGDHDNWAIRNIKLRHSRVILYAGLLFLLGTATTKPDRVAFLRENLVLTPLERIALSYREANDDGFFRIAGFYNSFVTQISDKEVRKKLKSLNYEQRYESDLFSSMKANSDGLIAELLRFILARRSDWSRQYFEYLIF